jgi:hypothetical protein
MPGATLSKSVGRRKKPSPSASMSPSRPSTSSSAPASTPSVEVGRDLVAVDLGDERTHVGVAGAVAGASLAIRSLILSISSSAMGSTAISAEIAMQRSPAEPKPALTAASAARSRSASGRTSMWFLAPPRAWTRLPLAVAVS